MIFKKFLNFNFKSHPKQCPTTQSITLLFETKYSYKFGRKSQDWWCTILRKKDNVPWFGWSVHHWFTTDTDNRSLVDDHIIIKRKRKLFWSCMNKTIREGWRYQIEWFFLKNSKRPSTPPPSFLENYIANFLWQIWLHICEEVWWP